jgi:hypothetical protein
MLSGQLLLTAGAKSGLEHKVWELPDDNIRSIEIDNSGNTWIGTEVGLAKFDGMNWTAYSRSNSDLPNDDVYSIAIDKTGYKWIVTDCGVAVYNEGGIVAVEDLVNLHRASVTGYQLMQNYPNPFNSATAISYHIPVVQHVSLAIYDINGRLVRTLVNEKKDDGYYTAQWDGRDNRGHGAPSGVYLYHLRTERFSKTGKAALIK